MKNELTIISKQHKHEVVTTMFDYYAMPADTPSIDCAEIDIYKRIDFIEEAIDENIGQSNCFFYFMLHEFEAILFSSPESFSEIADDNTVAKIKAMRNEVLPPLDRCLKRCYHD